LGRFKRLKEEFKMEGLENITPLLCRKQVPGPKPRNHGECLGSTFYVDQDSGELVCSNCKYRISYETLKTINDIRRRKS